MINNELFVTKHNQLAGAHWLDDFTIFDQQVAAACIAQIDWEDDDFKETTLDASELFEEIHGYPLVGERKERYYKDLKKLQKKLFKIVSPLEPEKENIFNWFSKIREDKYKDIFEMTINPTLIKYLIHLKDSGNFISPRLLRYKKSKNTYGIKLYQIMKTLNGPVYEKIMYINELKTIFNLTEKYNRSYDFKRYVINPAIQDINKLGDFHLEYEEIKRGRKVIGFKFIKSKNKIERTDRYKELHSMDFGVM